MTRSDTLLDSIQSADEATVLEAAQLLAFALDAEAAVAPESEVFAAPLQHRAEIAELCRLTLIVAATDPDTQELVEESLAGAGRKQLVLGGLEIVALGGLALGALHVCVSRGRVSTDEVITTERRPDGTEVTTVRRKITYGISAKIADLVRNMLGGQ